MNAITEGHWCLKSGTSMTHIVNRCSERFKVDFFDENTFSTTLLDDFDRHIWQADEVLLLTSRNVLRLYGKESVVEQPGISARMRFWWDLPDGDLKPLLQKRLDLRAMLPVAELGLASQDFVLRNEDEKIVVRGEFSALNSHLNEQAVETDKANRVSAFLTLKSLRGYADEYDAAVKLIDELVQQAIDTNSLKARIQCHGFSVEEKNKIFGISPDEPVEKAIREMSLMMLAQARDNEHGIIDDVDTEFLHQYRVSLRKTRSLLNLMKKALPEDLHFRLKVLLGELASSTNQLRDLDVFLLERDNYKSMLPDNYHNGVEGLFKMIALDREKSRKEVVKAFSSIDYQQKFAEVEALLIADPAYATKISSRPVKLVASKKIHARYEYIRRLGLLIDDKTPAEQVHDLRIECKKLRYLMEFFAELFVPKQIKSLIKSLKKLQTVLGDFNDYDVQKQFLGEYEKKYRKKQELSAATNGLIAVLHQKQMHARSLVMKAFADFNQSDTVAAFEDMFKIHKPEKDPKLSTGETV